MRKIILALIFACCTLSLGAQEGVPVDFKGDRPTISDFARAYFVDAVDEDDCIDEASNSVKQAFIRNEQGLPQEEGVTITVDEKNGFLLYESRYDDYLSRIEMCFWNEADKKHKLFAYNVRGFFGGKYSPGQFDVMLFYRYDNASKRMTMCDAPGFEVMYSEDGAWISYDLPRTGKDITVNYWYDDGTRKQKTLKWNGRRFF